MANISITRRCNQSCAYCFAHDLTTRDDLPIEDFDEVLDWLADASVDQLRLLGGEPTIHPHFPELLRRAEDRGMNIMVFSNGLIPDAALDALLSQPVDRCSVLINYPCPSEDEASCLKNVRRDHVLSALAGRANLGVNIYRRNMPLSSLLDVIDQHKLGRSLRLGLAHPRLHGRNVSLHPKDYPAIGEELTELASLAAAHDVKLSLDCGFVPCMFPDEFFDATGMSPKEIGRRCNPMPDILPDLSSIHCYALADELRLPIIKGESAADVRKRHEAHMAAVRKLGVYRHCDSCSYKKENACFGGCLAAAAQRFSSSSNQSIIPVSDMLRAESPKPNHKDEYSVPHSWSLPYIDQEESFWERLVGIAPSGSIQIYFPLPETNVSSGRPVQPANHLPALLKQSDLRKSVLINPVILPAPAERFRKIAISALRELLETSDIDEVVLADFALAEQIRNDFPQLRLTASTLMGVSEPYQAERLSELFDVLVPDTSILRDRERLAALKNAFSGRIRLMVNEGCLPGCPYRTQHFFEMTHTDSLPGSLCEDLLAKEPWRRYTGAWVLPQHLHLYDALADEYKLAGRVTLQDPDKYLLVARAYMHRRALRPGQIGAGPASVFMPDALSEPIYQQLLSCSNRCHECSICQRIDSSGQKRS